MHSQDSRAEALESLTSSFLSSRLHHCHEQVHTVSVCVCVCVCVYSISLTQSEIHYGVLQLLLSLSEQPTAAPWEPPHEEDPIHQGSNEKSRNRQRIFADTLCVCVLLEVGDGFDWAAYLREGIEYQTYGDSDSEVCL